VCKDSNRQFSNKHISFKIFKEVEGSFGMKFKNRNRNKEVVKKYLKKEEGIFFSRIIISHYIFYAECLKESSINF